MGNHGSKSNTMSYRQYFEDNRKRQLDFLATVSGYLENTSEWISIFKEKLKKFPEKRWSQDLFQALRSSSGFQDTTPKLTFAWNEYHSRKNVRKISKTNSCLWRESIANLETLSYEIEENPHKRILHRHLTVKSESILYHLITVFKQSLTKTYAYKENGKLKLLPESFNDLKTNSAEIDSAILEFCGIIQEVIPKFFLGIPRTISDIGSIVSDAVVSGHVLELLIIFRKELQIENENEYLNGLQTFAFDKVNSGVAKVLEREDNKNYEKAIENLVEITHAKSIGEMQDLVAMLMNNISISLYDPKDPLHVVEDDQIIEAFLVIICRSSAPNLPFYLDVLKNFLDEEALTVKDVGKGVIKLIYLLENVTSWRDFIAN